MTKQLTRRVSSTEYRTELHLDEFVDVVDSLGRVWDSLKHPRDRFGRFIRTFSTIKFNLPGESGRANQHSGVVQGVDRDGTLTAEITGVPKGGDESLVGKIIKLENRKVRVRSG